MKYRKWIIIAVLVLGGIFLLTHLSVFKKQKDENAVPVSIATVIKKDISVTLENIAQVQPYTAVAVSSQVDGQIIKTNFKEGDLVQTGQVLFEIDPRAYQAKVNQAQAQLVHDQAQSKASELLLERSVQLVKKGYLAKQDFDQTTANAESAKATVISDQATLEQAKLNLEYCTITAPITGRTGNVLLNTGNVVTAASKTTLVTINQIEPIYVSFTLPEKELVNLKLDIPVTAKGETGKLAFINNTIDNTTGTIQVKALFENKNNKLWPGQFLTVHIPLKTLSQAMIIPTEAIQDGQEGPYVYIVDEKDKVKYQKVTLGPEVSEGTVIEKGLQVGDKVVTRGQLRLTEGSKVSIQ